MRRIKKKIAAKRKARYEKNRENNKKRKEIKEIIFLCTSNVIQCFWFKKAFWDLDENGKRVRKGGYTFVVNRDIPNEKKTVDRLHDAKKLN